MSTSQHPTGEATLLLRRIESGDRAAADELLPYVYDQLRALAGSHFRQQQAGHTLQPTALVHEAYIKLVGSPTDEFKNRAHFCAVAATAMRQILINHAESKKAAKRGGDAKRVAMTEVMAPMGDQALDVEALNEALNELEAIDARKARIVELWFFGGLKVEEIAEVLGVSSRTVGRQWRSARIWLNASLSESDG